MKTYPLQSISIEEAYEKQFKLVDAITRNFTGTESLTRGDLGVHQPENEPITTMKAEKAIASFFDVDKAILVIPIKQIADGMFSNDGLFLIINHHFH